MDFLKECGPSQIDSELRSISPLGGATVAVMAEFLKMIDKSLATHRDFELAQAYLALFLKVMG